MSPLRPQNERDQDLPTRLGFTKAWLELGIVAVDECPSLLQALEQDGDPHIEHIRWRKFVAYLTSQPRLETAHAKHLYQIGLDDPDRSLGGSIMVRILKHPDCPKDLLMHARNSDRKYIRKAAESKLGKQVEEERSLEAQS